MKNILIIIVALITSSLSYAQSITYEYDEIGNRILRKPPGSLPVQLISFTAEKGEGSPEGMIAKLRWRTSSEINANYFNIERSNDAKKWVVIGTVNANGSRTTESYYSFNDNNPIYGENLYRLKMIDHDESFAYSRIESLTFDLNISFYPNPVSDFLKVKGFSQTQSPIKRIEVLNNNGTVVISRLYFPVEGVNVRSLPTGIYTVKALHNDGSSIVRKVIKE